MSVALHCDLVLAASTASFIQAFTKIGLIPDSGGTWLLPRLVGRANALGLAAAHARVSNDYQEGVTAFMEKRSPTFTDR